MRKNIVLEKKNYETFWLGGIWSKWSSSQGTELESCCILTTEPNDLVKTIHNRMPVIVPDGYEEKWTEQIKNSDELKRLIPILKGWSSSGWIKEEINKKRIDQMSLF